MQVCVSLVDNRFSVNNERQQRHGIMRPTPIMKNYQFMSGDVGEQPSQL